jgi:hypothetical protein
MRQCDACVFCRANCVIKEISQEHVQMEGKSRKTGKYKKCGDWKIFRQRFRFLRFALRIVCIIPHFYSISSRLMMRYVCASSLFTFHAIKLFIMFVRWNLKVKKVLSASHCVGCSNSWSFKPEDIHEGKKLLVEILMLDKLMKKKHPLSPLRLVIFSEARWKVQCCGKFNATQRRDFSFSRMTKLKLLLLLYGFFLVLAFGKCRNESLHNESLSMFNFHEKIHFRRYK